MSVAQVFTTKFISHALTEGQNFKIKASFRSRREEKETNFELWSLSVESEKDAPRVKRYTTS